MSNYAHTMVAIPPKYTTSQVIGLIKCDFRSEETTSFQISRLRSHTFPSCTNAVLVHLTRFREHGLNLDQARFFACHVHADWLLVYGVIRDRIIFHPTGTPSELFNSRRRAAVRTSRSLTPASAARSIKQRP